MRTTYYSAVLLTALLTITTNLSAQEVAKPRPSAAFEVLLSKETVDVAEVGRVEGTMRLSLRTGKPAAIYQGTYRVSADILPEAKARQYLTANKSLFGLTVEEVQSLRLHKVVTFNGGTVVRLRQYHQGLPVNRNAEITVHITPDNIVDFVQNGFVYGITMSDVIPTKSLSDAKQTVFERLQVSGSVQYEKSNLMMLRHQNTDYLVHQVVLTTDERIGEWEAFVDAKTGTLLKLEDISLYCNTHDHEKKSLPRARGPLPFKKYIPERITATGSGTVFMPDALARARKVYRWSGTIGDAGFVDNSDADSPELTAQVVAVTLNDISFDGTYYTLNGPYARLVQFESPNKETSNPNVYRTTNGDFSVTRNNDRFEAVMCYYHVDNQMRHLVVDLGLTGLMPHQYSGGVQFDPHGLSGADNSHYMTGSGRFAMGEGGVDDAEDGDVIIHELGHGLHDWATNGGLSQVQGLSEGTGDYNSGTYSRSKNPGWLTTDSQYYFQYNWDGHNPFFAGRELNYAGIYPAGLDPQNEPHRSGRIWAHANLRIADALGRNRSDYVFWRGMMTTNGSSNQNDAANAVYQMSITLGYTNAERLAIHSNYIASGYTLPAFTVLPVKLAAFDAKKSGKQTAVTWTTSIEENTQSFIVERSTDGANFNSIGTVTAAGNSSIERNYSFTDFAPATGKNYYRLKTTNTDGSASYSRIVLVVFDKKAELEIYPNPVHDVLTIKNSVSSGTIYLYDINGKQVRMQSITAASGSAISMNLSGLPNGIYMVKLETEGQTLQSRIVKK